MHKFLIIHHMERIVLKGLTDKRDSRVWKYRKLKTINSIVTQGKH